MVYCSLGSVTCLKVVGQRVVHIVVSLAHTQVLAVNMVEVPIVVESVARHVQEWVLLARQGIVDVPAHPQRLIPGCQGLLAVSLPHQP